MHIKPYYTHLITEKDTLEHILDTYVPHLEEQDIVVITSKIISILEGSVLPRKKVPSKLELIQNTSDAYLDSVRPTVLTIINNLIIPGSGIDESNGEDTYILHPKDPAKSAETIWHYLRARDRIKKLGVVITDSYSTPLRRGATGVSLSWCGFKPLYNYIGKTDCHGDPLKVTQTNVVDSLASAAVFCMGEGNEQTPLAIIQDAPRVQFENSPPKETTKKELYVSHEEDIYAPLLQEGSWVFK